MVLLIFIHNVMLSQVVLNCSAILPYRTSTVIFTFLLFISTSYDETVVMAYLWIASPSQHTHNSQPIYFLHKTKSSCNIEMSSGCFRFLFSTCIVWGMVLSNTTNTIALNSGISVMTVPQSVIPVVTHISGGAEQKTHRIIRTMQKVGHKD